MRSMPITLRLTLVFSAVMVTGCRTEVRLPFTETRVLAI